MTNTTSDEKVKPKANTIRIPFAQWVGHMCEEDLHPLARSLAIHIAIFKIEGGNAELQLLSGIRDRTYDKYKKALRDGDWVIISRAKGGRGYGIEVVPAYHGTPVDFTDLIPRNGGKYYPRNEGVDTGVKNTGVSAETPAESTGLSKEKSPYNPLKENNKLNSSLASNSREDRGLLAGLNGSCEPMIADIVAWMVGGDVQSARSWLMTFLRQYPQEVVRESYMKLKTDLAEGKLIARPLQVWAQVAGRLKAVPKPVPGAISDQDRRQQMLDDVVAEIEAENARRRRT